MAASSSQVTSQYVLQKIFEYEENGYWFLFQYDDSLGKDPITAVFFNVQKTDKMFQIGVECHMDIEIEKITKNLKASYFETYKLAIQEEEKRMMVIFECLGVENALNMMENINNHLLCLSEEDIRDIRFSIYSLVSNDALGYYAAGIEQYNHNEDLLSYIYSQASDLSTENAEINAELRDLEAKENALKTELDKTEEDISSLHKIKTPGFPTVSKVNVGTFFSKNTDNIVSSPSTPFYFAPT